MGIQPVYDAFFLYIRKYFIHSQYEKSCQSIISSGSFMIIYYLLIHNTHTLINPFLYHLSTYIKIVAQRSVERTLGFKSSADDL